MKLYTEEQVKSLVHQCRIYNVPAERFLFNYTPIELPTDEEVGKLRDEHIPIDEENMWSERFYFTIGAKWMRDKIGGQK